MAGVVKSIISSKSELTPITIRFKNETYKKLRAYVFEHNDEYSSIADFVNKATLEKLEDLLDNK